MIIEVAMVPPPFKNSKMLTRGAIITKPEYQAAMKAFQALLLSAVTRRDHDFDFTYPVLVSVGFWLPSLRTTDIDGRLCAVLDCLVKTEILEEDNFKYVQSCMGRFAGIERPYGKTRLMITSEQRVKYD